MDRQGEIPKDLGAASMVLTDFLAAKHKEGFVKLLAATRAELESKSGDPNAKIPPEKQREMFAAAFGEKAAKDFVAELKK
jgi:hypothetical protein